MDLSHDQLKELARKYLKGEATEEEQQLLHIWYDTVNAGDLEVIVSELPQDVASFRDDAWKEMQAMIAGRNGVAGRKVADDRQVADEQYGPAALPEGGRRIFPWRRVGVAACVVLLLGLAIRWYYNKPVATTTAVPAVAQAKAERKDAAPGGNKAVLTLDNGQSIVLDSAGKGALAVQGNMQVVKLEDGKILYRKSDAANGTGDHGAMAGATSAISYNVMSTPRGGQYQLTLPDGTKVWLNAASSIRYPTAFTGEERRVEIHGEAYFEVAANPSQPFLVDVDKRHTIEVLGTHFNVNAYEDEASVSTTLLQGSVRVGKLGSKAIKERKGLVIEAGEQLRIDKKGNVTVDMQPNIDGVMAWKNGIFSFDHSDIQSVMRQLARWYDMDVEFRGTPTTDQFGGDIRRSLSLSKVFRILERSQVHFNIEHGKIIVMP